MQFEISVLLRELSGLRGGDFYAFFAPRRHREHGEAQRKLKLRQYWRSDHNLLLRERDPGSELLTDTVRKIAEVVACQVILKVSRIEVICHIENL